MSEVEDLGKKLLETLNAINELKTSLEPFAAIQVQIQSDINMHRDAIKSLNEKSFEIDLQTKDIKDKLKVLDFDIKRVERDLTMARTAEALREEYVKQSEELIGIVAGAPWREFAFDHQISGGKLMATAKRGLLADKPGLGKSLTSLIWLDMLKAQRVVCVVPKDTCENYIREIRHWAPHRMVIDLTNKTKKERETILSMLIMQSEYQFVLVLNYEAWRRDTNLLEMIAQLKADSFIIDEAHTMKTNSTNAAKGITKMVLAENKCPRDDCNGSVEMLQEYSNTFSKRCVLCGSKAENAYDLCSVKNVLPMTGTPILNKPDDLFPLLHIIDPVQFSSLYSFQTQFCVRDYKGKWVFSAGGRDRLVSKLKERYVSRDRKQAGIIIPPQEIQTHNIEFDPEAYPEQAAVLNNLNKYAQIVLEENKALGIFYIIELILRKRQAILWPGGIQFKDPKTKEVMYSVQCNESIKLDRVLDKDGEGLLPELTADGDMKEGERVVIFSQFKTPLKELERRIKEYAPNISVVRFDGDTPPHIASEVKVDFDANYMNENGRELKWQVILANYKKGGVGLNFTGATQMIVLDEEWNPGKNEQAYGRIDRMGQTKETTVHVLRVRGSIDTWMSDLIDEKAALIDGFESATSLQQELLDAMRNGDML